MVLRWQRASNYFYRKRVLFVAKFIWMMIRVVFACDIPYTIRFGDGVQLFHNGLGVVIHKNSQIGKGTKIYQNVTIGGNGKVDINNGVPVIGEGVFIGAGAVIVGPITVGNGVVIGANAVVTESIPDNAVVVGVPGKIKYIKEN